MEIHVPDKNTHAGNLNAHFGFKIVECSDEELGYHINFRGGLVAGDFYRGITLTFLACVFAPMAIIIVV